MMKTVLRHAGIWARSLHIYASMAGLLLVLLFAVTGITLNHQDLGWGAPETTTSTVSLPLATVTTGDAAAIQTGLQTALQISIPASSYDAYDESIDVAFNAPGTRIHAMVDRTDGTVRVVRESAGIIGVVNDLHKGMEAGGVWRLVVDLTALLIGFSAVSGLVTLVSLPKRRRPGLLTTLGGGVVVVLVYWWSVPR